MTQIPGYKDGGWKDKYRILKLRPCPHTADVRDTAGYCGCVDGQEEYAPDPEARYFVLRFDTDPHARDAMRAYSRSVYGDNPEFANDILLRLSAVPLKKVEP